jgi:hypothetical protein
VGSSLPAARNNVAASALGAYSRSGGGRSSVFCFTSAVSAAFVVWVSLMDNHYLKERTGYCKRLFLWFLKLRVIENPKYHTIAIVIKYRIRLSFFKIRRCFDQIASLPDKKSISMKFGTRDQDDGSFLFEFSTYEPLNCGSGSSGGPRPSVADYVRGPTATRAATAAAAGRRGLMLPDVA